MHYLCYQQMMLHLCSHLLLEPLLLILLVRSRLLQLYYCYFLRFLLALHYLFLLQIYQLCRY
ncbi:hypothetical protein ECP03052603_4946 [Escherichia coli P0305260.3]|nr:hypothetical protein ECP03052603_4946 [Escherichia coli P0305260.3]